MRVAKNGRLPAIQHSPAAIKAKLEIRARALEVIGKPSVVFDAFAGDGAMFSGVWNRADRYVGCDLKWIRDGRLMFVADNRRVLRSIDLMPFNVFDLDAFGFPWEQALIVADRRPVKAGEHIAIILTEGGQLSYNGNSVPRAVSILGGIKFGAAGLGRKHTEINDRLVAGLARRMRCTLVSRWEAKGKTGMFMRYIALVLKGNGG